MLFAQVAVVEVSGLAVYNNSQLRRVSSVQTCGRIHIAIQETATGVSGVAVVTCCIGGLIVLNYEGGEGAAGCGLFLCTNAAQSTGQRRLGIVDGIGQSAVNVNVDKALAVPFSGKFNTCGNVDAHVIQVNLLFAGDDVSPTGVAAVLTNFGNANAVAFVYKQPVANHVFAFPECTVVVNVGQTEDDTVAGIGSLIGLDGSGELTCGYFVIEYVVALIASAVQRQPGVRNGPCFEVRLGGLTVNVSAVSGFCNRNEYAFFCRNRKYGQQTNDHCDYKQKGKCLFHKFPPEI